MKDESEKKRMKMATMWTKQSSSLKLHEKIGFTGGNANKLTCLTI